MSIRYTLIIKLSDTQSESGAEKDYEHSSDGK